MVPELRAAQSPVLFGLQDFLQFTIEFVYGGCLQFATGSPTPCCLTPRLLTHLSPQSLSVSKARLLQKIIIIVIVVVVAKFIEFCVSDPVLSPFL